MLILVVFEFRIFREPIKCMLISSILLLTLVFSSFVLLSSFLIRCLCLGKLLSVICQSMSLT